LLTINHSLGSAELESSSAGIIVYGKQILLPYRRRVSSSQSGDNVEMIEKLQFCNVYDYVST
jgi:hypothetical protein